MLFCTSSFHHQVSLSMCFPPLVAPYISSAVLVTTFLNNFQLSSALVSASIWYSSSTLSLYSVTFSPFRVQILILFSVVLLLCFASFIFRTAHSSRCWDTTSSLGILPCSLAFPSDQLLVSWWNQFVSCSLQSYKWLYALPFCWRKCSLVPSLGSPCFPRFSHLLCSFGHSLFLDALFEKHLDLFPYVHLCQRRLQSSLFSALSTPDLPSLSKTPLLSSLFLHFVGHMLILCWISLKLSPVLA